MALPGILRQLTQVFLTTACPLCQRSAARLLCDGCYRQMLTCKWPSSTQNQLSHRTTKSPSLCNGTTLSVFPWGKYTGLLKQVLSLLKYGDQADLGFWLGCQLGQQWRVSGWQSLGCQPIVVPVPLHRQRLKQRGYNQAALIAKGFCRVTGLPLAEHGLRRIKATDAMYSLGPSERQTNLTGAFQLGQGLPSPAHQSRPILLIDDIYTTGATVHTAAMPLIRAGYAITGIATVARAVLSSPGGGSPGSDRSRQKLNLHPTR